MCETTARDTFAGNTREYYRVFLESLDASQMFFAYHEQELIAAGIFIVEGNVMTYYYGASSSHKRNLMAPYLLQWTAIEHAKKRGLELYDFLGVAGDDEKNSSLSGVTDFKMKLSPNKTLIS
jgi:lipid II:glycine glycyltransferase (peptidoglycan interpeptide bridge formation enzyme)